MDRRPGADRPAARLDGRTCRDRRGRARALPRLARGFRADVVHLHAPASRGQARLPVPVVAVAHSCVGTWWHAVHGGDASPYFRWRVGTMARALRARTCRHRAHAGFRRRLARPTGRVSPIIVVHNGRTRRRRRATRGARMVLTAGRLWDEGKNIATLDRAAAGSDGRFLPPDRLRRPERHAAGSSQRALLGARSRRRCGHISPARRFSPRRHATSPSGSPFWKPRRPAARWFCPTFRPFASFGMGGAFVAGPTTEADWRAPLQRCSRDPATRARKRASRAERRAHYTVAAMVEATSPVHRTAARRPCQAREVSGMRSSISPIRSIPAGTTATRISCAACCANCSRAAMTSAY